MFSEQCFEWTRQEFPPSMVWMWSPHRGAGMEVIAWPHNRRRYLPFSRPGSTLGAFPFSCRIFHNLEAVLPITGKRGKIALLCVLEGIMFTLEDRFVVSVCRLARRAHGSATSCALNVLQQYARTVQCFAWRTQCLRPVANTPFLSSVPLSQACRSKLKG